MNGPKSLSIEITQLKNFALIEVMGEINMFTSPEFRDKLLNLYRGEKNIIVDLSDVSFMDSSGVATLVEGLSWSKTMNKEFVLIGLGLSVYNALILTKLEKVFKIRSRSEKLFSHKNGMKNWKTFLSA